MTAMAKAKYSGKRSSEPAQQEEKMPAERAEIIAWLKKVRFKPRIFGGVDKRNVLKKMIELDALYTKALEAERVRYNTLLEEYKQRSGHPPEQEIQPQQQLEGGGDSSG